jgi:hypothetical protein
MKTKPKFSIHAAYNSFGGVVCAGAVLLIASGAQAQNLFVANYGANNYGGNNITEIPPGGAQSTIGLNPNNGASPFGLAFKLNILLLQTG